MKQLRQRIILLSLIILIASAACGAPTTPSQTAAPVATSAVEESTNSGAEEPGEDLPLLPSLVESNTNGIGEPLPGGAEDPFAAATLTLAAELPVSPETAVVQQHSFGQIDETKARALADQFGFTGPLYVQQIAPEFAPPEGEESPTVFTAFAGKRILNIGNTGLTYEDRGVVVNYNQRPAFAEAAPLIEAQLKAWGVLEFPYELRELPLGDLAIFRLIDGVAVEQNQFNIFFNQAGEVAYFDYRPLRNITVLGSYPLQTAEIAWQQLQTLEGQAQIRHQLMPLPDVNDDVSENFVNPRSWAPLSEAGQEIHLYMTPAVYEATDGSELRLVYGDFTLAGDSGELAEIATHSSDVLHVWGTVDVANGAKILNVAGWEVVNIVQYETLEGTIDYAGEQALLRTTEGETFILAAAPEDIPEGIEAYVSAAARRDTGADYPLLDWNNISEKIEWPEMPQEIPSEEPAAIKAVTIDSATLIYFTLYQTADVPQPDTNLLFVPVWKFSGKTDQGQLATFWVSAVAPEYLQSSSLPAANSAGSINGWVWHDLCATAMDGQPALTSTPDGCIEAASPLGAYRANSSMDAQEPTISDLVVRLGQGACPATGLAEVTTIATDLSYSFMNLAAGTYCVSINPSEEPNLSLLRPGIWTFPEVAEGTIGTTVTLAEGQNVFEINFGWDHQFLP